METLYVIRQHDSCACGEADAYLHYQVALAYCLENDRDPAEIIEARWGESISLAEGTDRWRLTMLHVPRLLPTVFIEGSHAERTYYQAIDQSERDGILPVFPKLRDGIKVETEEEASFL